MIIACNKLRIGTRTEYKDYRKIEDRKGDNILSGNQTRDLALHFWRATLLASFFWHFQHSGAVAEW